MKIFPGIFFPGITEFSCPHSSPSDVCIANKKYTVTTFEKIAFNSYFQEN